MDKCCNNKDRGMFRPYMGNIEFGLLERRLDRIQILLYFVRCCEGTKLMISYSKFLVSKKTFTGLKFINEYFLYCTRYI